MSEESKNNSKVDTKLRSLARAIAFQTLYQLEIYPNLDAVQWQTLLDLCLEQEKPIGASERVEVLEFAKRLVTGYLECRGEVDMLISAALDKSRVLSRVTPIDRNILRVAAYEMRFLKNHKAVVISEAIKLGKKYGDKGSRAFINGVLDKIDVATSDAESESE